MITAIYGRAKYLYSTYLTDFRRNYYLRSYNNCASDERDSDG